MEKVAFIRVMEMRSNPFKFSVIHICDFGNGCEMQFMYLNGPV
jgi:hypothetical protein